MVSRARNPIKTKATILKEAGTLFAQNGYHGTSLNHIVQASGYNKRMIYHYFVNKEGLYRAIYRQKLQHINTKLTSKLTAIIDDEKNKKEDTDQLLIQISDMLFDLLGQDQDFVRLLNWQELENDGAVTGVWSDISKSIFEQTDKLIQLATRGSKLEKKLSTTHISSALFGIISSYFLQRKLITHIIGKDIFDASASSEYKRVINFFIHSLLNS
ncbi:MAG: TetR/AcrR family transcriptional regulator [Bacteriovoracaceae bacterium]|nr:TetR/AcrR family transcriptional regulator [Bacteriovoracaceae bacterium]